MGIHLCIWDFHLGHGVHLKWSKVVFFFFGLSSWTNKIESLEYFATVHVQNKFCQKLNEKMQAGVDPKLKHLLKWLLTLVQTANDQKQRKHQMKENENSKLAN